jgi:PAS domain-containing protein
MILGHPADYEGGPPRAPPRRMHSNMTALIVIYLIAGAVATGTAAIIWRRRSLPGAQPLALMMAATGIWAFCDAVDVLPLSVGGHRLVSQIQYLGVVSAAPFFFEAAYGIVLRRPLPFVGRLLVWAVPLATLPVAWTSAWHTWLWRDILAPPSGGPVVYTYGWWFWVLTADHYALVAAGTLLLLGAWRRVAPAFRSSFLIVVIAVALSWAGNVAYVFKLGPWPGLNWLSLSVGVSGLLFAWVVLQGGLFDLLPVARDALIAEMADGVVVAGSHGEVVLANAAAVRLLRESAEDEPVELLGSRLAALMPPSVDGAAWQSEVLLFESTSPRWLDVRASRVADRWGTPAGWLYVIRDVTARRTAETEREDLIQHLRTALHKIDALEGLLPICATCKRVRDTADNWRTIEEYIEDHTRVSFTHGICPSCSERFFEHLANARKD